MFFRIFKITLFSFLLISMSGFAQSNDEVEKQQAEFEKKAKEELDSRIQIFTADLKVDDFQKEIIKQKLESYYEAQKKILMDVSLKYYERDEQLSALKNSHFSDIGEMISDETMAQIQSFIVDAGTSLKAKKKKEKKKNKKKKD